MQNRSVEMVPYDNKWPLIYKNEAVQIQTILGNNFKAIHHIGSTAIPGMIAKPIIDIMLECATLDDKEKLSSLLGTLGYEKPRRQIIPHQSLITRKVAEDISFHLHIYEVGDPQIRRHVNFRDYVIAHPQVAQEYAELKAKLALIHRDDVFQYTLGKNKLVHDIDAKAKKWQGRSHDFLDASRGPLACEWTQEKIIRAMQANFNVRVTHFPQYQKQVEMIRKPGYTLVNSGLLEESFNYILDADLNTENANQYIKEITAYFAEKQLPFVWWISPDDQPSNLAKLLQESGYQHLADYAFMYFDLDAWSGEVVQPDELEIVRVFDAKTFHDFAQVCSNDQKAFDKYYADIASIITEEDPIEFYVGYVDGKPVVRGIVCFYAGMAGLHRLATNEDMRRKGYASAMNQFRLKRAKDLGYHVATLQSSDQAYSINLRLGYQECGVFREYILI